jgi:hypothetical protein
MVKLTGRDETACAIFTNACGQKSSMAYVLITITYTTLSLHMDKDMHDHAFGREIIPGQVPAVSS